MDNYVLLYCYLGFFSSQVILQLVEQVEITYF